MPKAPFRPDTDGFAFVNAWIWDATEIATVRQYVLDSVAIIEGILTPFLLAAEGPVLAAELGIPIFGPLLVEETIKAQTNAIVNAIMNALEPQVQGFCGGMAFTSLDYWRQGWVLPRGTNANDQPQPSTPIGTALREYIWNRLLDSLNANAITFVKWTAILNAPFGPGATWLRDQTKDELQTLRSRIDGGNPVTVGLIGTSINPFNNHQVVIYGYQDNPDNTVTLFAYDNNNPDTEVTYRMDFSQSQLNVKESVDPGARGPMRGLFCTVYVPKTPPRSIVLRQGLAVSPSVTGVNNPVGVQLTVANIGFHASPKFTLVVGGADTAPAQEASPTSVAEGATRAFSGTLKFSTIGGHQIRALATLQAKDGLQLTKTLPAETSAANPAGNVVIVGERLIDADVETTCEVWNTQGGKARFTVRVDDMGSGLTFAWTVTGATVLSGANSNLLEVQLPAQAGVAVTLGVTVKRPDGGSSEYLKLTDCSSKRLSRFRYGMSSWQFCRAKSALRRSVLRNGVGQQLISIASTTNIKILRPCLPRV
jgi:hypothetical protein